MLHYQIKPIIDDCQELLTHMPMVVEELTIAISSDITFKRQLREAEEALSQREAEYITEAVMRAKQQKEGPLVDIAVTSPAFKAACEKIVAEARRNGLSDLHRNVLSLRAHADDAQARREQLATRFSAMKHGSDLRTAMLNALTN
jgi:hypothetical protein